MKIILRTRCGCERWLESVIDYPPRPYYQIPLYPDLPIVPDFTKETMDMTTMIRTRTFKLKDVHYVDGRKVAAIYLEVLEEKRS